MSKGELSLILTARGEGAMEWMHLKMMVKVLKWIR